MGPSNLIDINQFPFNAPIGYSKNPLLYGEGMAKLLALALEETRGLAVGLELELTISLLNQLMFLERSVPRILPLNPTISGLTQPPLTLDILPFEIRLIIANELSQFDCLNLLRVSKAMYESTISRLYQFIVVDQEYSRFNNEMEYGFKRMKQESINNTQKHRYVQHFSCTFINSPYNFKRFIKTYNQKLEKEGDHEGFPYVRKFECIDLPDSLNIYDHELNDDLIHFFRNLSSLNQLIWLSDNFRLEFLHALPKKELITTLFLNIKFSNYLGELNELENDSGLNFPNLVNFQIQPFQNARKLIKIINTLLINPKNDPQRLCTKLETLNLSRVNKSVDNNISLPNSHDLITLTSTLPRTQDPINHSTLKDLDIKIIPALFKQTRLKYLTNLTSLSLDNILVAPADAALLIKSVNLAKIKVLSFRGISEYQMLSVDSNVGTIRDKLEPSFIVQIAPHLVNIKRLALDYRQALVESVPEFLEVVATKRAPLEALDLTIRLNRTKPLDSHDAQIDFFNEYAEGIARFPRLHTLSVEIRQEIDNYSDSNNLNVLTSVPPHTQFYTKLLGLTQLKCLRINPGESENVNEALGFILKLPLLKKLEIFGNKAGGSPNLGLGMVHPSLYDEWFKVQHVAIFYLKCNRNLQYIRINSCIFECDGRTMKINPRCGIARWFDQSARV
jgi:hypothetical protein